jgi:hypothetical protein
VRDVRTCAAGYPGHPLCEVSAPRVRARRARFILVSQMRLVRPAALPAVKSHLTRMQNIVYRVLANVRLAPSP